MDTIDRILLLQEQAKVNNKDLEKAAGLPNGSISKYKKKEYSPSVSAIIGLARYFGVTTDYLLCLSDSPTPAVEKSHSQEEELLLKAYNAASATGKFRIIQVCMNELDEAEKGVTTNAG